MGTTICDDAICIRHWDWSETSQTVSLFTREHGVVRGLAKGSKRDKAPFSGGIELLTRGEVVAIVRPSGALATLTAWDLTDAYTGARRSLRAFYVGSYLLDLVHHAVTDADPHQGLFDALCAVFSQLADRPEEALVRGQWAVLAETGYAPTPMAAAGAQVWFSAREGVFQTGIPLADGWRVRRETVEFLGVVCRSPWVKLDADATTLDRASRLLGSYLRFVLGREVPSALPVFGERGLVN